MTHFCQYDKFTATIKYRRDNQYAVRPEVEHWDGRRVKCQALWIIDDRPRTMGEWACSVVDEKTGEFFPRTWVAHGDLVDIKGKSWL